MGSYAKVTLTSTPKSPNSPSSPTSGADPETNNDLSVDIFLPEGIQSKQGVYYQGSRFEHGSMIGNIKYNGHVLYGTSLWRMPHNSNWPESGVGLASEFGVGDDGDFCFFLCGWPLTGDLTNGVLGYRQAKSGDSFLKIGVGELIKGSCPSCDSTEDYKFNSPYMFAKPPVWSLTQHSDQFITLDHKASLKDTGYELQKNVKLEDSVLYVTTKLKNTGAQAFSTVWYSHNFFHCDGNAVGPGYSIDMNLTGSSEPLYEEPGTWSWSSPLQQYASIQNKKPEETVRVKMNRALDPGVRIKTEFSKDERSDGSFVLQACQTEIKASVTSDDGIPLEMYAYNLYLERGTFSPEPQILLHLGPGESRQWTQRLEISSLVPTKTHASQSGTSMLTMNLHQASSSSSSMWAPWATPAVGASMVCFAIASIAHRWWTLNNRRREYFRIGEANLNNDAAVISV